MEIASCCFWQEEVVATPGRPAAVPPTSARGESAMHTDDTENQRSAEEEAAAASFRTAPDLDGTLRFECIEVSLVSRSASRAGRPLSLKPRQFDLLAFLVRNPKREVSQEEIATEVWAEPTATWTNVIAVSVHDLRKELEQLGQPTMLHTIRGRGYFLGTDPPERDGHASAP